MKAVAINAFGGKEELKLLEVDVPEPGPGQVLIRIAASGVNPVDVLIRQGVFAASQFPIIMGVDLSGVVEAVGPDVSRLKPGDEVYAHMKGGNGTYAEYAVLSQDWVARKPQSMTFIESATVPCAGLTAYQALTESIKLQAGESILITGAAGGVGAFAVQIAISLGAQVIGTASARNQEFLRRLGVHEFIDYGAEDYVSAVLRRFPQGG